MPVLATVYSRQLYSDPQGNDYAARYDRPAPVAQGGLRYTNAFRVNSAAGEDGVVTVAAPSTSGEANQFSGIVWSYSGDPTGGRIVITDGGTTVFDIDITTGGPGFIWFPTAMTMTANQATVLTIYDGGGTLVGKAGFLQFNVVSTSAVAGGAGPSSNLIVPGL